MNEKKALERHFLEEVAAIYPDFLSGTVIDAERPDFLVSSGSQVTGIEVVNYVRGQGTGGSDYRRNEILWQQIADAARREFESNHSDPLMVHFMWHSNRYPRKVDVPLIAASTAKVIEQYIPQTLFERTHISDNGFLNTPLYAFANSIYVTRVRNVRQVVWSSVNASFISVSANELRGLLASKSIKVREYLRRCTEVLLLIVADGRYISSTGELLQEEVRRIQLQTTYQRVLFYDRPNRLITSLTG